MTNQQYLNVAIKNIAVTIDFSECSERAVQHGLAVARHFGATLHFLYLVRPSEYVYTPEMIPALDEVAVRDCDQLIARLKSDHRLDGVKFQRWVEEGEISEVVGDFVQKHHIDLLVVGTHGRTGIFQASARFGCTGDIPLCALPGADRWPRFSGCECAASAKSGALLYGSLQRIDGGASLRIDCDSGVACQT